MGKARFLYNNLITSENMLSVSSLRPGMVSQAKKEGVGAATLNPGGTYTGATDKAIIVECDSIAAGAEVGQATFRWSDGTSGWNATGVTTSASNILLVDGIYVNFSTGPGADFVVGDRWDFKALNMFNAGKMIDLDRDHRYRSAALASPNTITVSLGSALEVKALIISDHNLSPGATITIKANSIDSWVGTTGLWDDIVDFDAVSDIDNLVGGAPLFSEAIAWNDEKIVHFLTAAQTYRYWQPQITDAGNPNGHIAIGELFLGSYLELSKNFREGYSWETKLLMETNSTPYGVRRHRFYNTQKTFTFDFERLSAADVASLETLIAAICSRRAGTFKPFFFCPDSAVPNETYLVEISSLPVRHRTLSFFDTPLTLTEVVTSV